MKFKDFVELNESNNVRGGTSVEEGNSQFYRFSIRSRSINYFMYVKDIKNTNSEVLLYQLKRNFDKQFPYSKVTYEDNFTETSVKNVHKMVYLRRNEFPPVITDILSSFEHLTNVHKVMGRTKFKNIQDVYNFFTLKKNFRDGTFNFITNNDFENYINEFKSGRGESEGVTTFKVGKNIIPVSPNVPKKNLELVEKGLNVTYRLLKRWGVENLFDETEIVVNKISGRWWGLYNIQQKNIIIDTSKRINHRSFVRTLIHEIGHKVDWELFSNQDRTAIRTLYFEKMRKDKAGKNIDGKFSNADTSDGESQIVEFFQQVYKLHEQGKLRFYWRGNARKKYGTRKNTYLESIAVGKRLFVGSGVEGKANVIGIYENGQTMRHMADADTWEKIGIVVNGKQYSLGGYYNKEFGSNNKNITSKNGKNIYNDNWFVTDYAKTNEREFWAEMFASVLTGEKVHPPVKKFVLNILKDL